MKILRNEKGFTLIELVLIIIVLGILAAVAIVQFGNIATDARNAALDGAVGPYAAQTAIAVNNIKGLPLGGNGTGTCLPSGTSAQFEDCVYNLVVHSGAGITRQAYDDVDNAFAICTGATCGGGPDNLATNGGAGGTVPTGCVAPDRFVVLDYQAGSGAIFVSAKTNC